MKKRIVVSSNFIFSAVLILTLPNLCSANPEIGVTIEKTGKRIGGSGGEIILAVKEFNKETPKFALRSIRDSANTWKTLLVKHNNGFFTRNITNSVGLVDGMAERADVDFKQFVIKKGWFYFGMVLFLFFLGMLFWLNFVAMIKGMEGLIIS